MTSLLKNILGRAFIGAFMGIGFATLIALAINAYIGLDQFIYTPPLLIDESGSAFHAAIIQTATSALLGASFAATSVFWEFEHWGLFKQTALYFLVNSLVFLFVSYSNFWMNHTIGGFLSQSIIFITVFILVWLTQYAIQRHHIRKLNAGLKK